MLYRSLPNHALYRIQHDFIPVWSCILNILAIMGSLTKVYDDGQILYAVFIYPQLAW